MPKPRPCPVTMVTLASCMPVREQGHNRYARKGRKEKEMGKYSKALAVRWVMLGT